MSRAPVTPRGEAEEGETGPGQMFAPFLAMEDLLDKLKLLNYEKELVLKMRMRPINRHYFMIPTNSGEQFFIFTSLSAWLIRTAGRKFDPPQEFDDPNSTISNILEVVRDLGIAIDFAPSKLKQGVGEQAVFVLGVLADEALKAVGFKFKSPIAPSEEEVEDEEVDEDMEVDLEKVEETMAGHYSDEEEGDILHIDEYSPSVPGVMMEEEGERIGRIMESKTNAEEWRLEVERVAPSLKMTVKTDGREWRNHLEQMHNYRDGIEEALTSTKLHLDQLQAGIAKTLEKITSREKYINNQLEQPLSSFKQLSQQLAQAKEQYRQVSGGVVERSRLLAQLTDELETVKAEMEERGSSMTDGSPLVSIRRSLARVRSEITGMDVRIGVVEHSLLQGRMKDRETNQRHLTQAVREESKAWQQKELMI